MVECQHSVVRVSAFTTAILGMFSISTNTACLSLLSADTDHSSARSAMVSAARALLAAVTRSVGRLYNQTAHLQRASFACLFTLYSFLLPRLLILADMVDVHLLMEKVNTTQDDLGFVRKTSSQPELMEGMRRLEKSVAELSQHAARRQRELKDPLLREGLAAARATLVRQSPLLLTSSNVHVRYPVSRPSYHSLSQTCVRHSYQFTAIS